MLSNAFWIPIAVLGMTTVASPAPASEGTAETSGPRAPVCAAGCPCGAELASKEEVNEEEADAKETERPQPERAGEQGERRPVDMKIPPHAVTAPAWATIRDEVDEGSRIGEVELEADDGKVFYEVEYTTPEGVKYELHIDVDGKLLKKELDD